jgi:hypothetical protein
MRTKSRLLSGFGSFTKLAPLAIAVGLAVSASGCVIDSSNSGTCFPDLFVPWQIVEDVPGDPPLTCAQAGATSVEIDVNGQAFLDSCPANATGGQFSIPLADAGNYTLDGFLLSGNVVLSEVHPPSFSVGCSDVQTPTVTFPVAF